MTENLLKRLTITLLFLLFTTVAWSQFSFTPKRANVKFFHTKSTGWIITDITGTQTLTTFNNSNAYVQIINGQIKVYTMPEGIWNTHPTPQFMNKIHISHSEFKVAHDPSRFDPYTSFWISSKGGHIRIFKHPESVKIDNNGTLETRTNQNVSNHIFINGNKKAKISSTNTIFMIAPKGNIFEIDHNLNIWRFILTNRTLTPWTSEPPSQKMAFHIFKKEDFKMVIPIGTKQNQYVFQVIDHKNKMGIATLSTDYFEITYNIPPIFDFISPSLNSNVHLVSLDQKLGILHFLPQENPNEIPEFKTTFLKAKKSIHSGSIQAGAFSLLLDGKEMENPEFSITQNSFKHHFGIIKISEDLILYNESHPSGKYHHSGLYKISQNNWYIAPKAFKLTPYENALLEMNNPTNSEPIYNVYTPSGRLLAEKVTSSNSSLFSFLTGQILNQDIDSMVQENSFTPYTYKFKSETKWGLAHICMDTFKIIQSAKYLSIQPTNTNRSLVLTQSNSFDWYHIPNSSNTPEITTGKNPLYISKKNTITSNPTEAAYSAQFSQGLFFYNTKGNSPIGEIHNPEHVSPIYSASSVIPYPEYIHCVSTEKRHHLLSYKTKPIKTPIFDSLSLVKNHYTLFFNSKNSPQILKVNNQVVAVKKLISIYYENKPFKALSKHTEVYFYNQWFLCNENEQWILLVPWETLETPQTFPSLLEAIDATNTLKQ